MEGSTGAAIATAVVLLTVGIGAYAYFFWGVGVSPPSITTNITTSPTTSETTTTSNCSMITLVINGTNFITCITIPSSTTTTASKFCLGNWCLDALGGAYAISGAGAIAGVALIEGSSRTKSKEFKGNLCEAPLQDGRDTRLRDRAS